MKNEISYELCTIKGGNELNTIKGEMIAMVQSIMLRCAPSKHMPLNI